MLRHTRAGDPCAGELSMFASKRAHGQKKEPKTATGSQQIGWMQHGNARGNEAPEWKPPMPDACIGACKQINNESDNNDF